MVYHSLLQMRSERNAESLQTNRNLVCLFLKDAEYDFVKIIDFLNGRRRSVGGSFHWLGGRGIGQFGNYDNFSLILFIDSKLLP